MKIKFYLYLASTLVITCALSDWNKPWYIQATTFIEQLVEDETHMEGIPTGCSKIMNVNLRLEDKHLVYPKGCQMTEAVCIDFFEPE